MNDMQNDSPASMIGWLILNSFVSGVEKTGGEDGMAVGFQVARCLVQKGRRSSGQSRKLDAATYVGMAQ